MTFSVCAQQFLACFSMYLTCNRFVKVKSQIGRRKTYGNKSKQTYKQDVVIQVGKKKRGLNQPDKLFSFYDRNTKFISNIDIFHIFYQRLFINILHFKK